MHQTFKDNIFNPGKGFSEGLQFFGRGGTQSQEGVNWAKIANANCEMKQNS